MTDIPPIIRPNTFLELRRYPDSKPVFVDPAMVVVVEPAEVDADSVNVTAVRSYALGGITLVYGEASHVAMAIQRSRNAMAEITLGALVEMVREEIDDANERQVGLVGSLN